MCSSWSEAEEIVTSFYLWSSKVQSLNQKPPLTIAMSLTVAARIEINKTSILKKRPISLASIYKDTKKRFPEELLLFKVQRVGLGLQWTTTKGVKYKSNIKCKIKERKTNNLKDFSEMTFSRNKEGMDALLLFTVSPLFYFLQNSFTKYPLFHIIFRRSLPIALIIQIKWFSLSYFFSAFINQLI